MIRKLNVFLSDNNYLDSFLDSKEKNSNVMSVESVTNLKFLDGKTRAALSFFGVENHKVWRETFVPLAQQLIVKSNLFNLSVNMFNFKPSTFQIYFCRDNNITLYINVNDLTVFKDIVDTLSFADLKTAHINYYVTDKNVSDVHKILEDYAEKDSLNVSFKILGTLSEENKKTVINEFEAQKDKLLNKTSKLAPMNFAYYSALDILSMDNVDFSTLKDNNEEVYLSNNMMIYRASDLFNACTEANWIGKIEKDDVMYRNLSKFVKDDLNKTCGENDVFSYISFVNPSRNKEDLKVMSKISDELYSMLKFSKDEALSGLYEKMKIQAKSELATLRFSITSIPYDTTI